MVHGPLAQPVQYLKGIGPKKAAALEEIGIHTVLDLLYYLPRRYLDRSTLLTINRLREHVRAPRTGDLPFELDGAEDIRREVTVIGEVRSHRMIGAGRRARFVLVLGDATGSLQCVWFGGVQYWRRAFQVGETLAVSGEPTLYGNVLQMVHPDVDRIGDREGTSPETAAEEFRGGLVPLYPSSQALAHVGLESSGFRRIIASVLQAHGGLLREYLPPVLQRQRVLPDLSSAIQTVHFPRSADDLERARARLKYDELFLFQLKLALKRRVYRESVQGISFNVKSPLARTMIDALPFSLTGAQVRVLKEIAADLESPRPMNRLLQGDVGSGKTVVALTAMLVVVDNGYQAVFMAPTEILAEQHYATLRQFLGDLPVNARLLVGAQRSRLRRDILEDLRSGRAQIVVGTHALLEKDVEFARLGLVVIDEQHRFGVRQRALVRRKGENPDVLVMTATPIPRTLSLTLYGDLEVSVLDELPQGRKPIVTVVKHDNERGSVYAFVRDRIAAGRQAYFVYPLIEESEKVDLKSAKAHFEHLQKEFPSLRLGLIHGRLRSEEKDAVMKRFKERELDILVSTTVIEVGIDVPNATIMVIENAEQFGLSQLHQLRGRVGRGSEQSHCILVAKRWVAHGVHRSMEGGEDEEQAAARRLATMVRTTDGFVIAETDLQLRGPGDFFGTRQSGMPEFRAADLRTDTAILHEARADAFTIVEQDPLLRLPEHRALADHLRSTLLDDFSLVQAG